MARVKRGMVIFVLVILNLSWIQREFRIMSSGSVHGVLAEKDQPQQDSLQDWFSGSYQAHVTFVFNQTSGFRNALIKLNNQLDFTFFAIPHAAKIVIGKEGYLMGEEYIESYLGLDYVGEQYIQEKTRQLKFIQDQLWEKYQVMLVVIFAPDKAMYYSEYIPARYLKKKLPVNNYTGYAAALQKYGVNFIDFNQYFLMMKDTSRFSLYPKTGIHWSMYGSVLAADTLIRYLAQKMQTPMPELVIDSLVLTETLHGFDDDIASTLNLLFKVPHTRMAYPVFHVTYPDGCCRPSVLFVGDSYYWHWHTQGLIRGLFSNEDFWYYHNEVYPQKGSQQLLVKQLDRLAVIRQHQVIILMQVVKGSATIGFGLPDAIYFGFNTQEEQVHEIIKTMRLNPVWMDSLKVKADRRGIPMEEMMRLDAIYLINNKSKKQ